jgi:hypothetical protein
MLTGFSPAIAEDKTAPAVQCNFQSMLWATDYHLMHLGGEVDAAMTDSLATVALRIAAKHSGAL